MVSTPDPFYCRLRFARLALIHSFRDREVAGSNPARGILFIFCFYSRMCLLSFVCVLYFLFISQTFVISEDCSMWTEQERRRFEKGHLADRSLNGKLLAESIGTTM